MRRACFALVLGMCVPAAAAAQQGPADVLGFLVTNQSVQTGDFQKDQSAAAATRDTIIRALQVNLATVPIATSSSGFTYRLDPELGTATRVSDNFGTFFVERAATSGAGRVSFGVSGTAAFYDRLDGFNLRDGTLQTTANQFQDESSPFDTESLTLKIRTNTMTLYGTVGVTDRLDIGAALPFVQLRIDGSRLNVYRGDEFVQASGTASASGVADAAIRAKYLLVSSRGGGFAVAGELRLPTGNEASLLGAGKAAIRVMGIGSIEQRRVGVHGNISMVQGGVSDEIAANGAVTYAATPKVTVVGEFLMRHLSDLQKIAPVTAPHPFASGVITSRLVPGTSNPTLSSAVTGVKWNAGTTFVLTVEGAWRIGQAGLTSPFVPTIALDYLF